MFQSRKYPYLVFFLLLALCLMSSSLFAQSKRETFTLDGTLHKKYPLRSGGILSVNNVNGNIRIESWNKNEVDIEVDERRSRGSYDIEIEILIRPDRIEIDTNHPRSRNRGRSSSAHYTIKVPKEVEIYASSTNGSVLVRDINGPVEAGTTNGSVTVEEIDGEVDAHTTNGDIDLQQINGDIKARTTNQSITLYSVTSTRINASTTNGGIRADFNLDSNGRYDFSTTNGNVRVTIPEDARADVEAHCRSSKFRSDFDVLTRSSRDYRRRNSWSSQTVRGEINGGGALLSMRTSNGRIDLRAK